MHKIKFLHPSSKFAMKLTLISALVCVFLVLVKATGDMDNVNDNVQLTDKLNALSSELESRIKLELPRIIQSEEFRVPAQAVLQEFLNIQGGFLPRYPIITPSPFPPLIPLPDLRIIKFDFDIIWGNLSFWDQTLGGLNGLKDDFIASEVEGGYRVNYHLGFPKVSLSGQYDIDITTDLSTGPVIFVLSLVGNGESYISFENITMDLQIDFGKQPDSDLVKIGAQLNLNAASTGLGFENFKVILGDQSIVIPPGSLDPILTPLVSTILGIAGPLIGVVILQPLVQNQYKACTLQETIDFFNGLEGSNLFCAIPTPSPTPNPSPTTTPQSTPSTTPSGASRHFQNLFPVQIVCAFLLLRVFHSNCTWISNLIF